MYLVYAPFFLRWFYPEVVWNKSRQEKKIYLTFDDGPIPEITPWILDTLLQHNVKATFFCVGENITKYPEIFERIKKEGHQVGNHTYNHLKGWDVKDNLYLDNIAKCQQLTQTNLLRPPYGKAKKSQLKKLKKEYSLIYWDVLSGDFDVNISPEQCWKNVKKHTKNGSIIVFHDNIKSYVRLQYALPQTLSYYLQKNYEFGLI